MFLVWIIERASLTTLVSSSKVGWNELIGSLRVDVLSGWVEAETTRLERLCLKLATNQFEIGSGSIRKIDAPEQGGWVGSSKVESREDGEKGKGEFHDSNCAMLIETIVL